MEGEGKKYMYLLFTTTFLDSTKSCTLLVPKYLPHDRIIYETACVSKRVRVVKDSKCMAIKFKANISNKNLENI